tara:strand:- start:4931 stop:6163 length:1233 start_codon:yes stop_codon:yes gene_type:complete
MKVAMVNYSDINGGAARAAYRIHHALQGSDVDSTMLVNQALAGDSSVKGPVGRFAKASVIIRTQLGALLAHSLQTSNPIIHSPAVLPSCRPKLINQSDVDLVHLHWVNGEMLSIADIGRIEKPVVWTLHDMWAFCGAEHVAEDFRWRDGYHRNNRPVHESGFDLNRWTWRRKHQSWKKPQQIVTPSTWLARCVRESELMSEWPVAVIPNALNMDQWQPVDKILARELLGLPCEGPLVLFGAMGGASAHHKGFDLLQSALEQLRGELDGLQLLVFGQLAPKVVPDLGFPVHYTGHLHDDLTLRVMYSAADALVIPSRQDNLPNTGVESLACGTPVIAFDTCGLPDIVDHQQTGYLASAFDTADLAAGIKWVLNTDNHAQLSVNSRAKAVQYFDSKIVAKKYVDLYQEVLSQ